MGSGWTYQKPESLIVRNATGGFVKISIADIPQDLYPPVWFVGGQAAWQYNLFVTKRLVLAYLNKEPLEEKELKRLATYILAYTQHLAIVGWLFQPSQEDKIGAYQINSQLVRRLKGLRSREPFMHEYVTEMLSLCLDCGVDPL